MKLEKATADLAGEGEARKGHFGDALAHRIAQDAKPRARVVIILVPRTKLGARINNIGLKNGKPKHIVVNWAGRFHHEWQQCEQETKKNREIPHLAKIQERKMTTLVCENPRNSTKRASFARIQVRKEERQARAPTVEASPAAKRSNEAGAM